jgi:hypothetical protein
MPDVFVYRSDQPGAPVLGPANGTMCSLVYACLVTGFGTITATSLTRSGSVATLAFASAHTYKVDDPIVVAGATPAAYNIAVNVTAVTSNTISFPIAGTPTTPATGTITCKIAPAGWTRPYTSGNVSVFRSANVTSSQRYLRLDDSITDAQNYKSANAALYEAMTAVSTGTLRSTKNWRKSPAASPAGSKWVLIASDKAFYFLSNREDPTSGTNTALSFNNCAFFGDINSYKTGDTFNCLVTSVDDYLLGSESALGSGTSSICRAHTLTGGAVDVRGAQLEVINNTGSTTGLNPADSSLIFTSPRLVIEGLSTSIEIVRGVLPGFVTSVTTYAGTVMSVPGYTPQPSGLWEKFSGVSINGSTRTVMLFCITPNSTGFKGFAIDITGPW